MIHQKAVVSDELSTSVRRLIKICLFGSCIIISLRYRAEECCCQLPSTYLDLDANSRFLIFSSFALITDSRTATRPFFVALSA